MSDADSRSPFLRTLRGLVPASVRAYRRYPGRLLALALLLQGPVYVLLGWLSPPAPGLAVAPGAAAEALCAALGALAPALLGGLLSGLLYVVLSAAVAAVLLGEVTGQPTGVGKALAVTGRRLGPLGRGSLLAVGVVSLLLALPLGALGFVQGCYAQGGPGGEIATAIRRTAEEAGSSGLAKALIWSGLALGIGYILHAAVKWVVMPQVALLEGGSATQVLWRSRNLVRGRWLTVAFSLLLLLIVQALLAWLLAIPFLFVSYALPEPPGEAVRSGIRTLAQLAALPLGATGATLLYLHLRHTREGLTTERLADEARAMAETTPRPAAVPSGGT